jgi:hypothetical protein
MQTDGKRTMSRARSIALLSFRWCRSRTSLKFKFPSLVIEVGALIGLFWYAHSASIQAVANQRAAEAAKESADAAIAGIRAWVALDLYMPYKPGDSQLTIRLKNIGKSPAFAVWNTEIENEIVHGGASPHFHVCPNTHQMPGNVFPYTLAANDTDVIHEKAPTVTLPDEAAFQRDDVSIYVHTCVYYKYISGRGDGLTEICGRYVRDYVFGCALPLKIQ